MVQLLSGKGTLGISHDWRRDPIVRQSASPRPPRQGPRARTVEVVGLFRRTDHGTKATPTVRGDL